MDSTEERSLKTGHVGLTKLLEMLLLFLFFPSFSPFFNSSPGTNRTCYTTEEEQKMINKGLNQTITKHRTVYRLQHEAQSIEVIGLLSNTVKNPSHQILLALQS